MNDKIDLNGLPKSFCNKSHWSFGNEFFIIGFQNGMNINAYALTPGHVKQIAKGLNDSIEKYEEMYGKITNVSGAILSPLSSNDLGGDIDKGKPSNKDSKK